MKLTLEKLLKLEEVGNFLTDGDLPVLTVLYEEINKADQIDVRVRGLLRDALDLARRRAQLKEFIESVRP